jgi:hypothetical protein
VDLASFLLLKTAMMKAHALLIIAQLSMDWRNAVTLVYLVNFAVVAHTQRDTGKALDSVTGHAKTPQLLPLKTHAHGLLVLISALEPDALIWKARL